MRKLYKFADRLKKRFVFLYADVAQLARAADL